MADQKSPAPHGDPTRPDPTARPNPDRKLVEVSNDQLNLILLALKERASNLKNQGINDQEERSEIILLYNQIIRDARQQES